VTTVDHGGDAEYDENASGHARDDDDDGHYIVVCADAGENEKR
jgi:hypothetical protein